MPGLATGPFRLRPSRPRPGWPNTDCRPKSSPHSPAPHTSTRKTPPTPRSASRCRCPPRTLSCAKASHALLPLIHEGIKYARAGIMVTDLRPTGNQAPLAPYENPHEERRVGTLLEDVTRRCGRGSIGLGHAGIRGGPDWRQTPCHPSRGTDLDCRSRNGLPALVHPGRLMGHQTHGTGRRREPGGYRILARPDASYLPSGGVPSHVCSELGSSRNARIIYP